MEADSASSGPRLARHPFAGASTAPLFQAALLFALGIMLSRWMWIPAAFALVAIILAAVVSAVAAWGALRVAWLPMMALWFLLGVWSAEVQPQPSPAPALAAVSDGLLRSVEGTIVAAGPVRGEFQQDGDLQPYSDAPLPWNERPAQRLDLRISSVEVVTDDVDEPRPVSGNVRLNVRWPDARVDAFRCGDRIRVNARLLEPEVFHDPGVWNGAEYLVQRGITATGGADAKGIERLGSDRGVHWSRARLSDTLRCTLSEAQEGASARLQGLPAVTRGLPPLFRIEPEDAVMLSAMITGDRTFLTHSLRAGFERTGSFHMLVVSGFHLAIVSGCIFWFTKRLRIPRVPATLLTLAGSMAYALFTGFGTPVQRSLSMVALYLVGRLVYRERSPLNVIGFAALCLLAVDPRSLFDAGFQMTLLAVVAIGGIAAPWLEATIAPYTAATRDLRLIALDVKLPPKQAQFRVTLRMLAQRLQALTGAPIAWRWFPGAVRFTLNVCELLIVSVVVELAMTLPMAVYFHRLTLFALPVNLLIFPLLLILVPAALITLLAAMVAPAVALIPAACTALLLHAGVILVRFFGGLRWGDVRVAMPLMAQAILFCVLLGVAVWMMRGSRWQRTFAAVTLLLAAAAALVPRSIEHPGNALEFEAIDVGQGDSLLLISPEGRTLLIDGGGLGGPDRTAEQTFDIGEEVVSAALWSRGIHHLDAVALTHAHSDHMGGLPAVLRNFHPGELWVGNNPPIASYRDLLREAADLKIKVRRLRAGDAFPLGSLNVHVLAPLASYTPGPEPTNNDSLVLRVAYGATSVLLEGDAEAPVEQAMLREPDLASSLLKVGHHGSVSSTTPAFLASVAPQWAVISCGLRNRYGHPRPEVLSALEHAHARTYSTDVTGATCFALDGKTVKAETSCP